MLFFAHGGTVGLLLELLPLALLGGIFAFGLWRQHQLRKSRRSAGNEQPGDGREP